MKFGGPLPAEEPQPSELYFVLEPTGSEILSGVHIEIVAAAASLIQVEFDGLPVMNITVKKSYWSRMKKFFFPSRLPPLYEQGKQLKPEIRPGSAEYNIFMLPRPPWTDRRWRVFDYWKGT